MNISTNVDLTSLKFVFYRCKTGERFLSETKRPRNINQLNKWHTHGCFDFDIDYNKYIKQRTTS